MGTFLAWSGFEKGYFTYELPRVNHPSSQPLPEIYFDDVKNDVLNVFFCTKHWCQLKFALGLSKTEVWKNGLGTV